MERKPNPGLPCQDETPVPDYGTARPVGRNKRSALRHSRAKGGRRLDTAASTAVFEVGGAMRGVYHRASQRPDPVAYCALRATGYGLIRPALRLRRPANPKLPRDPFKGRRDVRLDLTRRDRAHPIVPRLEPRALAGPGLSRLGAFPFGHKVDHGAQRERHDVDNMRPNRDLALEAAAGETAIPGERLPQGPLGVSWIAAQQARQPAHRPALARHPAAAVLGQKLPQHAGLPAVEDAASRRSLAAFGDRR